MINPSDWLAIASTIALGIACLQKDVRWIGFFLFLSSVVYFFPSVVMLFDGSTLEEITFFRKSGSTDTVKFLALTTVALSFYLLCRSNNPKDLLRPMPIILSVLLLIGMFTLDEPVSRLKIVNVFSIIGMAFIATASANALEKSLPARFNEREHEVLIGCLWTVLLLSVVVAFFELSQAKAWASYYDADSYIVIRASSLFFNPNLFGLFCALLAAFFSFYWHSYPTFGGKIIFQSGIFLAGLGIYLASSRSLGYLLLAFFIATSFLLPKGTSNRFKPAVIYVCAMLLAALLSIMWWKVSKEGAAGSFLVLAKRLVESPFQILAMCLDILGIRVGLGLGEFALKPETVIAVEGRFLGGERDSGLLRVYDDSGWPGISGMLLFWLSALYLGVRAYANGRSAKAAYALSITCLSFAVGALMRYQVYPVWLWIALMLAPCLVFWRMHQQTAEKPQRVWL